MHFFERLPKDPQKRADFYRARAQMKRDIVCRCCVYPKEVECLTKCKMYDDCNSPSKKKKPKKLRYLFYPL